MSNLQKFNAKEWVERIRRTHGSQIEEEDLPPNPDLFEQTQYFFEELELTYGSGVIERQCAYCDSLATSFTMSISRYGKQPVCDYHSEQYYKFKGGDKNAKRKRNRT